MLITESYKRYLRSVRKSSVGQVHVMFSVNHPEEE
jgi:hypothetical protein